MKIAYFDCFSGISGDMIIGALLDLGVDFNFLKKELKKLDLKDYELAVKKEERNHLWGKKFVIKIKEKNHQERHLNDIINLINNSRLSSFVKEKSISIFQNLANVEAKIHQTSSDKIHFHEVGAIDAIIDIVGSVIGIENLGIEGIYCSSINLGSGFIKCRHGILPVPAPATVHLLKNFLVYTSKIQFELTTPTGAAIISTLADPFVSYPLFKIKNSGFGIGETKIDDIPNLLRIIIGETEKKYQKDSIFIIKTNIDDMNPQIYDYLMEKLFENGALDVYITPIIMKKNRPAQELTILLEKEKQESIIEILFQETTTIGLRIYETERRKLFREIKSVNTNFGKMLVKEIKINEKQTKLIPEYEECKKIAQKKNIPLKEVMKNITFNKGLDVNES